MAIADLLLNIVEMVPCGFCCLLSDEYPLCARGIDITYPQTQFAMVTSFGSQTQGLSKNKLTTNEVSVTFISLPLKICAMIANDVSFHVERSIQSVKVVAEKETHAIESSAGLNSFSG